MWWCFNVMRSVFVGREKDVGRRWKRLRIAMGREAKMRLTQEMGCRWSGKIVVSLKCLLARMGLRFTLQATVRILAFALIAPGIIF